MCLWSSYGFNLYTTNLIKVHQYNQGATNENEKNVSKSDAHSTLSLDLEVQTVIKKINKLLVWGPMT